MPESGLELKLHSPAGAEPAIFTWPLPTSTTVSKVLQLLVKQGDMKYELLPFFRHDPILDYVKCNAGILSLKTLETLESL